MKSNKLQTYETKDYTYACFDGKGYAVIVKDKTKTEYEPLLPEINGKPLVCLAYAFENCKNMIRAPVIPDTVYDITGAFDGCDALYYKPTLKEND